MCEGPRWSHTGRGWLWFAFGFEGALLGVALLLTRWSAWPLAQAWLWRADHLVLGIVASLPLLLAFAWMRRSRWRPLRNIREFLEGKVVPIFRQWRAWQWGLLAVLAGVGEELLFRGSLAGLWVRALGPWPALLAANGLFALAHAITWTYAIMAGLFGLYFAFLWLATGNLLVPAAAHAVYDFVALFWLLRPSGRRSEG